VHRGPIDHRKKELGGPCPIGLKQYKPQGDRKVPKKGQKSQKHGRRESSEVVAEECGLHAD